MKYLYNGVSLQNRRQSNMDRLLLKTRCINGEDTLLAVVCDGVGSLAEGAFASGLAVKMIDDWFGKVSKTERIGLILRDTVLNINTYIISEARHKNINTASTLSALLLVENFYYIVHVGDSRIYSLEDGILSTHTNDDVSASGKLTACIGQTEETVLQYSEGSAGGKTFLVCSDGLYKRMDIDFMTYKMNVRSKRDVKRGVAALTQYVIKNGEQDNISLAIIRIES